MRALSWNFIFFGINLTFEGKKINNFVSCFVFYSVLHSSCHFYAVIRKDFGISMLNL